MAKASEAETENNAAAVDSSDRLGLYITAVGAAVGIVIALISTVSRLAELAKGKDIPVLVPFSGEDVLLGIGPDGAQVTVGVNSGTILVNDPAAATEFALWAQPIFIGVMVIAGLVVAAMFVLRLARGRAFDRGTSRLALIGAAVVTAGWFVNTILTNMVTNGSLAAVSDGDYESVTFSVSLLPVIAVFMIAAVGVALQIGERLQRDNAGLV